MADDTPSSLDVPDGYIADVITHLEMCTRPVVAIPKSTLNIVRWSEPDPEEYLKRSPISLVGNVTTPTMLMTGEEDYRTPIAESEQYYQALKLRGIDTALVRIPGASHGIAARPSHLIAKVSCASAATSGLPSTVSSGVRVSAP